MSGIINDIKNALHQDHSTERTTGHHTATGSGAPTGTGTEGSVHGTTGVGGVSPYHITGSTNPGPHHSNLANKADPRVDSDSDGSNLYGTHGHATGASTYGSTNAGPHSSNLANKADPRVDSDRDGSHNTGAYGSTGTHAGTGYQSGVSHSTNAGPHNSNLANKADPRVDSDLDGRGNRHGATTGGALGTSGSHATAGSGTAQNTAGPHNSDLLNKLDPRVDSDRDGSKTAGVNQTHA